MTDSFSGDTPKIRNISSGKPFKLTALEYYKHGWYPIPLPPKDKFPPPTSATGRKNPIPEDRLEAITEWLTNGFDARVNGKMQHYEADVCNIGIRLDETVVGIDVDNYEAKHGAAELAELEKKYGKLPRTWISTARTDGFSGIRFFRIPKKFWPGEELGGQHGLSFSGKAANAIEVVQYVHRYAAVSPSYHPKQGTEYAWFAPDEDLGVAGSSTMQVFRGISRKVLVYEPENNKSPEPESLEAAVGRYKVSFVNKIVPKIPYLEDLPELPDAWIEYLSRGFVRDDLKPRDITSTEKDLLKWAAKKFPGGRNGAACKTVRKASATHKDRLLEDESSHDKIVGMHWNLFNYALEGHRGTLKASRTLENVWRKSVLKGNASHGQKRFLSEANSEMFRSRVEALRKIKGEADSIVEVGGDPFRTNCTCFDEDDAKANGKLGSAEVDENGVPLDKGPVPTGSARDPGEYEMNDDGNGYHLMDLYGENLKFVGGFGAWIFWNGERWTQDEDGLARRCYRRVKERQDAYATQLFNSAQSALGKSGGDEKDKDYKKFLKKAVEWRRWADQSGNNQRANGAAEAARANYGVTIQAEKLDQNVRLLGVDNGVIELLETGIKFRQGEREDYIVTNTGIPYVPLRDQITRGGDLGKGVRLWQDYLELFLPDTELRYFFQKAMGYCLFGRNIERLGIFLYGETSTGKSTALSAIMNALGEYASPVEMSIFKDKDLNPGLAQAMPRRIITTTEAGAQNFLHADTFKRMTGGDAMSAELKGVNTIIRRIPAFVPVIATNSPPNIRGADKALEKRLLIIPFDTQITEEKDEKQGSQNLVDSAKAAVLGWLVEGWIAYAKEGLPRSEWPGIVQDRTKEFSHSLNDIGEFLADWTEETGNEEDYVACSKMYDAFVQWATVVQRIPENQIYTLTGFGKRMTEQGFKSKNKFLGRDKETGKTLGMKAYFGIKLQQSGENMVNGRFTTKSERQ